MALVTSKGTAFTFPSIEPEVTTSGFINDEVTLLTDVERENILTQREESLAQEAEAKVEAYEEKTGEGLFTAALKQENVIGAWLSNQPTKPFETVEGYNPFDTREELAGYEKYANEFVSSGSPEETNWIKNKIDEELERKEYLNNAGLSGILASVGASILDPVALGTMLIPGGAHVKGASLLMTGAKGAASSLAGEAVIETAMHQNQLTRTIEDSALNIGVSTLLGGGLSMGLAKLVSDIPTTKQAGSVLSDRILSDAEGKPSEVFTAQVEELEKQNGLSPRNIGAAQVANTDEGTELASAGLFGAVLTKASKALSPNVRLAASPEPEVRDIGARLMSDNLLRKANVEGDKAFDEFDTSAEDRITLRQGTEFALLRGSYIENGTEYAKLVAEAEKKAGIKLDQDFESDVMDAFYADRANLGNWVEPVRNQVEVLDNTMKQYTADMINTGLLSDRAAAKMLGVDVADVRRDVDVSEIVEVYKPYQWDFDMIRRDRVGFEELIRNHLKAKFQTKHSIKDSNGNIIVSKPISDRELSYATARVVSTLLDDSRSVGEALEELDDVLGGMFNFDQWGDASTNAKIRKAFGLDELDFTGYQRANMTSVLEGYVRHWGPRIELQRTADELTQGTSGKLYPEVFRDHINDTFLTKIAKAEASLVGMTGKAKKTAQKELDKLKKEHKTALTTVENVLTVLDGSVHNLSSEAGKNAAEASRVLRTFTQAAYLSGVVLSSISDVVMPAMVEGIGNATSGLYHGTMRKFLKAGGKSMSQLSREEFQANGIAIQSLTESRIKGMAEMSDNQANYRLGVLSKAANVTQDNFGKLTFMNPFTDMMQIASANATHRRLSNVATSVTKGKPLSKSDRAFVGKMGLSDEDLINMVKYQSAYGDFQINGATGQTFFQASSWSNSVWTKAIEPLQAQIGDAFKRLDAIKVEVNDLDYEMNFTSMGTPEYAELSAKRDALKAERKDISKNIDSLQEAVSLHKDRLASVRDLSARLATAILNRVDSTITSPSKSDLPTVMHKEWGKLAFQFKSWAVAFTGRTLIPALQNNQVSIWNRINFYITIAGIGAMHTAIDMAKHELNQIGKEDPEEYEFNVAKAVQMGIEKSGVLGLIGEGWNMAMLFGNQPQLTTGAIAGAATNLATGSDEEYQPEFRFGSTGAGVFSIPALSYGAKVGSTVGAFANYGKDDTMGEAGLKQFKLVRDIMPYNNALFFKQGWDFAENTLEAQVD